MRPPLLVDAVVGPTLLGAENAQTIRSLRRLLGKAENKHGAFADAESGLSQRRGIVHIASASLADAETPVAWLGG